VRWLDANYQEGEHEVEKIDWKCELEYVGWLIKEDDNAITLSLEKPHEGKTRNPFTILKRNVVEVVNLSLTRKRVKRPENKEEKPVSLPLI
jgi:hypothetical protein